MEEWRAIASLAYDRCISNSKADKGSCVVVWDRNDCFGGRETT